MDKHFAGRTGTCTRIVLLMTVTVVAGACSPVAGADPNPPAVGGSTVIPVSTGAVTAVPPIPNDRSPLPVTRVAPSPGATSTFAPADSGCSIVYAFGQQVFCQRSFALRDLLTVADGPATEPLLSPDGRFVLYAIKGEDVVMSLRLARTDGSAGNWLLGSRDFSKAGMNAQSWPLHFQWRPGTRTLLFNTMDLSRKAQFDPSMLPNADLWALDADSGVITNVVTRQGAGRFAVAPDGRYVALSLPKSLELFDLDKRTQTHLLDFAPIDNDTPAGYLPRVDWSPDGRFFSTAIPSSARAPGATATLYQVAINGQFRKLGMLQGSFMVGGPMEFEFSPDRAAVVYGTVDINSSAATVHMARCDGSGDRVLDTLDKNHDLLGLGWSPDARHYLYALLPDGGLRSAGSAALHPCIPVRLFATARLRHFRASGAHCFRGPFGAP